MEKTTQESNKKVAFKLPQIGSLWYENIFVSETHPILYTCVDKQNNHYICLFSVESAKLRKWLISPVEIQTIIDMLEDKITIRECLAQRKNKNPNKYTFVQVGNKLSCLINEPVDWDYEASKVLPTRGAYMEAEEDEFKEEIQEYREMQRKQQQIQKKKVKTRKQ